MRFNEIGRCFQKSQRRELAALNRLHCRDRAAGRVACHIAKHRAFGAIGADQKSFSTIGANKHLLAAAPALECAERADRLLAGLPAVPERPAPCLSSPPRAWGVAAVTAQRPRWQQA